MKKLLMILCLLLAFIPCAALAESDDAVVFGAVTAPRDAEYIDMGEQLVEDWDDYIAFLQQFPNLKKVDMFSTIVNAKRISQIEQQLPGITFGWTIHITHEHYIRTDQTAFSTLHGYCPNHDSKTFEVLKYCTELRALDLGHNNITDISFLRNLPKLRVLILACNADLNNLEVLSDLKELEYIELFSCSLRDLSPLKELPHLMDLNIAYNTRINSYDDLAEMPQLKRLWISNTGLSYNNAALQKLSLALPNTKIVNVGEPTQGGWRIGHHYETIYEIFHTDKYIPFEDSYPLEDMTEAP